VAYLLVSRPVRDLSGEGPAKPHLGCSVGEPKPRWLRACLLAPEPTLAHTPIVA
jgi:hypothetical protein